MELQTRERLVGAAVLVLLVVLLVPSMLGGRGTNAVEEPAAGPGARSIELTATPATQLPADEDQLVPEAIATLPAPTAQTPAASEPLVPEPAAVAPSAPIVAPGAAASAAIAAPDAAIPTAVAAWAIQLGAFSTRVAADKLVAELRAGGYSAFVLEYRANGAILHRVRVGPEQDRARAEAVAERLKKAGYKPIVAAHP